MGRTSSKRDEILHFLTKFTAENGYAPSVREICAAVGLQSTAIAKKPRRPSIIT